MSTTTATRTPLLVSDHDYCDRCIARARSVVRVNGSLLFFCGHHFNKNRALFDEKAYEYVLEPVMP